MAKKIDLTLIIPAFNEEKRLPKRFDKANQLLKSQIKNIEILFVNDGSTDKTEELLKNLAKKYRHVNLITYPKNRGKGFAIKQGVKKAKGEVIGFTDADFAVDLKGVKIAVETIKKGADLVIGNRNLGSSKISGEANDSRRLLSKILGGFNQFFLPINEITDSQNGFKFFKKKVAREIFQNVSINRWLFDVQLLSHAKIRNYKIEQQAVSWREIGDSKVSIARDLPRISWDLIKLYFQFLDVRFFALILSVLLLIILFPFLINPESLTRRNGDFSDLVWPDYYFIKESILKLHQIPFWNPTLFSGIPEIANPQSPLIYPPNALALVINIDLAIVILFFLHALIAGIFFYKLTRRRLNWSNISSVAATFTFVFSPFFWSKIAVGHLSQIFAIFLVAPILYFGLSFLQTSKKKYLALTAIVLALQYLNYPTIWYFTCFFAAIFLLGTSWNNFKRKLLIFLIPVSSLIFIAPIFLTQLKAGPQITRSILNFSDLAIPVWSISRFIKSVLVPSNLVGDGETEVWLYVSVIALLIGVYGLLKLPKRVRLATVLVVVLVILITLGVRTPVFGLLSQYFPGFSYLRVSTRDWFIFVVVVSFLVGWAMQKIDNKIRNLIFVFLIFDLLIFSSMRIWFIPKIMDPNSTINLQNLYPPDVSYRTYCTNRCLSPRDTLPQGIITADGYHLLILRDYRNALSDAGGFKPPEYTGNLPTYSTSESQPSAEKLGKMAVKWVISRNDLDDKNLHLLKVENGFKLYENMLAKKRFYFSKTNAKIIIERDTPNAISLRTEGDAGILTIADSFYPGWEATIDGKKVNIEKYDGWARDISVPQGKHQVKFDFYPFQFSKNDN